MLFLMLMLQDPPSPDAAMAKYRELTRVSVRCRAPEDGDEIVVCANREADRFRLPLVEAYAGDHLPDKELDRLIGQRILPECGQGAFMAKCGFVGVSVTAGGRAKGVKLRPLAP
jgi:hypothetical protein